MKAYQLHDINNCKYEDVKKPVAGENTVIVKVHATGICGSDIPRIYRNGTYSYPLIPGHEFSGEVCELGENVDIKWLNKAVGIFPLIPCMECEQCKKKQYEMCRKYSYLGSRTNGGYAEYVKVPVWNLIELPENVSYEQAAMLEPMAVAVHAMRRSGVIKEDRVAICGAGTIGLFLYMFLRNSGVNDILVIGNKEIQKRKVKELGCPEEKYFDSKHGDAGEWLRKQSEEKAIDVFFDCVGTNEVVSLAVENVAPSGTVFLVGNPASDMQLEKKVYWKILRNQLTLLGTWNSSFTHDSEDDWNYILDRLESGAIHPEKMITHRFPLENLASGFELMRDKTEEYIKVMGIIS